MSTFKYGNLEISVEQLSRKGQHHEYGIRIQAPDHPLYSFRKWYAAEADLKDVAQVLVYDMMEAYGDPKRFLKREVLESKEENREFIDVSQKLHPFLHQAHLDIHKEWGFKPYAGYEDIIGPREWFPRKG